MNNKSIVAAMCALLLTTSGCATMIAGGHTTLNVRTPTPEAEVVVKDFKGPEVYRGPSPAVVRVSKSSSYVVTITAPGYKEHKQAVTKGFQGWTVGNLGWILPIFMGIGVAIDAMSGAIYTLDPEDISVSLVREQPVVKNEYPSIETQL